MYRVSIDEDAIAQIDALPFAAALGYAEAFGVMKLVPWSGLPLNTANPDGAMRQLIFEPGSYGTGHFVRVGEASIFSSWGGHRSFSAPAAHSTA